jgi:hypothetical protein
VIAHFNDVYDISERKKDPVGGASRFAHKLKEVTATSCGENRLILCMGRDGRGGCLGQHTA